MNSSIINKIRILKPRKKANPTLKSNNVKSFTIMNDNCHSSINLQKKNEQLPPLIAPKQREVTNNQSNNHWVPVYIVNVPNAPGSQPIVGNSGNTDNAASSSVGNLPSENTPTSAINTPTSIGVDMTRINEVSGFISSADSGSNEGYSNSIGAHTQSEGAVGSPCNQPDLQLNSNTLYTRQEGEKGATVNCFLCPKKFNTVQEMQSHYLENHKQKRRSANLKPGSKKSSKSTKLKDALIGADDCSVKDGEPKCPICSIYFKTKDEVKSHMTSVHCYKCSECQNTFYTLFQFTDHRCVRVVRQRKPKLKKKKIKITETTTLDKDPLSLSPNLESKKQKLAPIQPKIPIHPQNTLPIHPQNTIPIFIQYPLCTVDSVQATTVPNDPLLMQPILKPNTIEVSESNQDRHTHSLATSCTSSKNNLKPSNSLLQYSLEQLTSKEFNRMKLNEIIKNPNLSVNWIKKEETGCGTEKEFFACGRCNVLCEDGEDYVEHLEECLRLSNVSLLSTINPPQRMLKLKTEMVPQKVNKYIKSSINKKLLKELKSFIKDDHDIFVAEEEVEEEPSVSNDNPEEKINNSDCFYHPDIKGNISITKLTRNLIDNKEVNQFKIVNVSSCNKATSLINYSTGGTGHQPMVIIPLNNSSQESNYNTCLNDNSKSFELNELDQYPNISITDKSNSVTWNFIGSDSGALVSVESPLHHDDPKVKNLARLTSNIFDSSQPLILSKTVNDIDNAPYKFSSMTEIVASNDKKCSPVQKKSPPKQSEQLKSEPSSPHQTDFNDERDSLSPESSQDKFSSLELVLDEEEIKMEVEDEVVDDSY